MANESTLLVAECIVYNSNIVDKFKEYNNINIYVMFLMTKLLGRGYKAPVRIMK